MTQIPEDIIIRSFQKTATEDDMKILDKWLKESSDNVAI